MEILVQRGLKPLACLGSQSAFPVAGRLKHFRTNWALVTRDRWILDTVQGYKIEFIKNPVQAFRPRVGVASAHEQSLMQEEIQAMLLKGAITELTQAEATKGFFSSLFLVPKKNGGTRPVFNLKGLNEFIPHHHFKMEGIQTLKDILSKDDWMTKVDLKDAYFAIPIHEEDRSFLRFSALDCHFQFTCLPFGLSSAPWVFTKTLRPIITLLRELGVRLVAYIDDILVMAESPQRARDHTLGLIFLLESLGFIVHPDKSITNPSQEIEFLGMQVHSKTMELRLPGQKLKKLRTETAKFTRSQTPPSAREVSRLLGKLNSVSQAVPPGPLFCRMLQRDLTRSLAKGSQSYKAPCPLSAGAKEELTWWTDQLARWNGKSLVLKNPDLSIESDASLLGWGASCQGVRTGGPWSPDEKKFHINCLELLAASFAVNPF